MRYILNDSGYIEAISFGCSIECKDKTCTEYTGSIPEGYETLAIWSETANINAYKIVEGNLTYDSTEDARLQALWESQLSNSGTGGETSSDSIPIGSIFEYDGDTVPSGYEEVVDENTYSTEEQKIGTWIDNKPIYRKVMTLTSFSTGETTINHNISNINEIINIRAIGYRSGGDYEVLPAIVPPSYQTMFQISIYDFNTTRFRLFLGSNMLTEEAELTRLRIVIEYTKTTD